MSRGNMTTGLASSSSSTTDTITITNVNCEAGSDSNCTSLFGSGFCCAHTYISMDEDHVNIID